MTAAGALRPAPTAVPAIGSDVEATRSFERTGSALARSVAAAAATDDSPPAPFVPTDDLGAELTGSLALIAAVLLPALIAIFLLL